MLWKAFWETEKLLLMVFGLYCKGLNIIIFHMSILNILTNTENTSVIY